MLLFEANRETPLLSRWVVTKRFQKGQEGIILSKKRKDSLLGSLTLLQQTFPIQELNRGFLNCRRILYQLRYHGSPPRREDHTRCSRGKTSSCCHHYLNYCSLIVQRFTSICTRSRRVSEFRFLISCRSSYEWSADIPIKFPQWWVTGWETRLGFSREDADFHEP